MINPMSLEESAIRAVKSGSDGIIVTGSETGHAPTSEELAEAKKGCGKKPLIIGSGLDINNCEKILQVADGAIVGQGLMKNNKIDKEKSFRLMQKIKQMES